MTLSGFGQSDRRLKFGLSSSLNRTYIEQLTFGDGLGAKVWGIKQPYGFSFGVRTKFYIGDHININTGLDLLSFQSVRYFYHGYTHTNSISLYELPLEFQFNFKRKKCTPFIVLGIEETFNLWSIRTDSNVATIYSPATKVTVEDKQGLYTILKAGVGFKLNKPRTIEYRMIFSKGFSPVRTFKLERFDPGAYSTFIYQGTKLEMEISWYFNRKKNK